MTCVTCLLEEPSAKEMLMAVLPKLLSEDEFYFRFIIFEGKQDLDKNLERRLRGWLIPNTVFLIIRDQDSGDCAVLKSSLRTKVQSAGKDSRTIIRIACRELESYYLGDLFAVEQGLEIPGLAVKQVQAKYRVPDTLGNPADELKKLTSKKYQKVSGSRAISQYLKLDGSNKSHSFGALVDGIQSIPRVGG